MARCGCGYTQKGKQTKACRAHAAQKAATTRARNKKLAARRSK